MHLHVRRTYIALLGTAVFATSVAYASTKYYIHCEHHSHNGGEYNSTAYYPGNGETSLDRCNKGLYTHRGTYHNGSIAVGECKIY